ncbi:MAG: rod shape-determining protein MreD [Solirubrobacterales bacterium]
MILTWRIMVRLGLLALFTVMAELSFFGKLSILGTSPDFATLVVMSLGLLGGSVTGAVAGFSIGLLIDTLTLETLGATALTLIAVGYLAGRYRESLGVPNRGTTALLGGGLTMVAWLCFAFLQLMLGLEADVSPLGGRDIVVASLLGALLAVPVQAGVRRLLRPALIDEDRPRASRPVAPTAVETR